MGLNFYVTIPQSVKLLQINFFLLELKKDSEKKITIHMEVAGLFLKRKKIEEIEQQFSLQYFHPFLDFYAESIVNC